MLGIALTEAFRTLRGNVLHTLLSTLGIVIGVAALVGILSLGDGMEQYAREQLANTTDLNAILVTPKTREEVDGMWMKREAPATVTPLQIENLKASLPHPATLALQSDHRTYFQLAGDTVRRASMVSACLEAGTFEKAKLAHGRLWTFAEALRGDSVAVLNKPLAEKIEGEGRSEAVVGKKIHLWAGQYTIIGVVDQPKGKMPPRLYLPLPLLPTDKLRESPPAMIVIVNQTEHVPPVKKAVADWLERQPGGKNAFELITNDFRVEQLRRGILMFKSVMGLIVGIAILVGGIGIMNVLLMSVTERTREIGIRKAMGAKRKAIGLQFIAESLVISMMGCIAGLVVGLGFMAIATPLVRHFAQIEDFRAAFSLGSFLVIAGIAALVGVFFGVFPALKAAKLSPVDAMRHE